MGLSHALAVVLLATLAAAESASYDLNEILTPATDNHAFLVDNEEIEESPSPSPAFADDGMRAVQLLKEQIRVIHKMFVVMHEKVNWETAKKVCEESGMNLATIRSEEEQIKLEQLLMKRGVDEDAEFWLGGHDLLSAGEKGWTWSVGSRDELFTYKNWKLGEPNNWNGPQGCLQLRVEYNYTWDDNSCFSPRKFICEN